MRTIQDSFIDDASARAATKTGIITAIRMDWLSAAMTPRKRYSVKRKKGFAPGWSPIPIAWQFMNKRAAMISSHLPYHGEQDSACKKKGHDSNPVG